MKIDILKFDTLLAKQGLTLKTVGEKAGVSRQTLTTTRYRGSCSPIVAGKIARALNVDVTELIQTEV